MSVLLDYEREIMARELESFLPDRIYDVHAHLYRAEFWDKGPFPYPVNIPPDATLEVYREQMGLLFGEREIHGMHFPLLFVSDTMPGNEWISEQVKKDPLARGQFLVRPTDDPEWVRQEIKRLGLRGLKPFCVYSTREKSYESEIPEYLPEPLIDVANQEGWSITLHLIRDRGVADASNQHWIRHYCEKYPNIKLILDHCARGFNPYHTIEGLQKLTGLKNLWIDTSVVCNPLAIQAVIKIIGTERMLYGSDFCLTHLRSINTWSGDGFIWIPEDSDVWKDAIPISRPPLLTGIENLRAIKAAFWSMGLGDKQVEDFFWGNAMRMLEMTK